MGNGGKWNGGEQRHESSGQTVDSKTQPVILQFSMYSIAPKGGVEAGGSDLALSRPLHETSVYKYVSRTPGLYRDANYMRRCMAGCVESSLLRLALWRPAGFWSFKVTSIACPFANLTCLWGCLLQVTGDARARLTLTKPLMCFCYECWFGL